ncbi:MAG TPA: site-2 protease family protein [Saprospiraceae bacterium]|nr:site-2 protease family protein [Saprospiraceae bacterium]
MRGTFTIASAFKIPIKIHWSFSLLIAFLAFTLWSDQVSFVRGMWFAGYVACLFICVVLHEYGHALMAKKYGIKTKDIIISPIGGVARLEKLPESPKQEMIVAIAGPLVNVVIALLAFVLVLFFGYTKIGIPEDPFTEAMNWQHFTLNVAIINMVLFWFNLIPAFPMDGGRILRSALSMKWGKVKATQYASVIGRVLSLVFVAAAFLGNYYTLGLIGVFIFFSATAENKSVKTIAKLEEFSVSDVMRKNFTRLHIADLYQIPMDLHKRNIESNFLIFDSLGYIAGCIPELFVLEAIKNSAENAQVTTLKSSAFGVVDSNITLRALYEKMAKEGLAIVAIMEGENIIGVIDQKTFANLFNTL